MTTPLQPATRRLLTEAAAGTAVDTADSPLGARIRALLATLYGTKGEVDGVAGLDETGKVPFEQLPEQAIDSPTVDTLGTMTYWKSVDGVVTVTVTGLLNTSTGSKGAGTLPAGFRPAGTIDGGGACGTYSSSSSVSGRLRVDASGAVTVMSNTASANVTWYGQVSFVAAP